MTENNKYPAIVYKYRNWISENHKDVLNKNQLFFSSPKEFNDPFDCRIPTNFSLLDTKEKIEAFIKKSIAASSDGNAIKRINIEEEASKLEHEIKNTPRSAQDRYEKLFFEGIDKHYGILSLSLRWDGILMWSHYGNNHKGYCVGFVEEKLRQQEVVSGGKVHYPTDNKFPILNPLDDYDVNTLLTQINSKSKEWEYEKEYRLFKVFYPEIPAETDRTLIMSDDYFSELIIGLNASKNTREQLIEIAKAKKIKVYQAIKTPFKFEIDRKEIF